MPLRQRGGQPIPLRRPHLRRLRRRPSGLRQRLRHSSLSPHPPKWIPLPLRQPPRPPMDRPLPSPVVWRLLSMLRILSKGGGGGVVAHWWGNDDVRVLALACCCWRRGEDVTINIRWEVGGGSATKGGFEVVTSLFWKPKENEWGCWFSNDYSFSSSTHNPLSSILDATKNDAGELSYVRPISLLFLRRGYIDFVWRSK